MDDLIFLDDDYHTQTHINKGKTMSKFHTLNDGEQEMLETKTRYLRYACCDCGMVHDIVFELDGDILRYSMMQSPRATAQLRRKHFGNLHNGVGKWRLGRIDGNDTFSEC